MQSDLDFLNSLSSPTSATTSTAYSNSLSNLTLDDSKTQSNGVKEEGTAEAGEENEDEADDEDGEEGPDLSDEEVAALLRKLEEADQAADGIEGRLDNLLGTLDGLLKGLEGMGGAEAAAVLGEAEAEVPQPPKED